VRASLRTYPRQQFPLFSYFGVTAAAAASVVLHYAVSLSCVKRGVTAQHALARAHLQTAASRYHANTLPWQCYGDPDDVSLPDTGDIRCRGVDGSAASRDA